MSGSFGGDTPLQPEEPVDPCRAELERYLGEEDTTRLGDVYRWKREDLTPEQMVQLAGTENTTFIWNYSRILHALLERDLPTAPSVARHVARRYRSLLKRQWSEATRARLTADLEVLERRAEDVEAVVEESEEALKKTKVVEEEDPAGIYVYSLPHYIRYPYDPESGRTLLKVGHSQRDAIQRMQQQTRTTALPEEPVLLRVYPTEEAESAAIEKKMHLTLRAFDHGRKVQRMAGREWFLTTTRAIDAVADLLALEARVINDDADYLVDE